MVDMANKLLMNATYTVVDFCLIYDQGMNLESGWMLDVVTKKYVLYSTWYFEQLQLSCYTQYSMMMMGV
jgi:hypothetical protein